MNKKVLFVSYHFPSDAAVGALRTQKFVKYLPGQGWKPFVLTVKDRYHSSIDKERLKDVREALVERTSFWRTPLQLLIDLRDGLRVNMERPLVSTTSAGDKPGMATSSRRTSLKRWLVCLNWFPDDKLYWLFPALHKGLGLIRAHNIRQIVVSAPPHSSILIAYLLTRLTGAKLIIDFRDPWLLRHEYSQNPFKPQKLLDIELRLQTCILRHAAAVVTTNDFFRSALLNENDFLSPDRVHVVHNGYDLADFPPVLQREEKRVFSISYLGTFYMQRNPENFLRALALFMDEKGLSASDVEVRFVGDTENASGIPVRPMIEKMDLGDVVLISGKVDYARSLQIMRESNVLLLLAPGQPYQIPAKTYEYMAAGRPILALSQAGATSSLIESMGCGIVADPDEVEDIKTALVRLHEDHMNRAFGFVRDASAFERHNQTALLARILERLDA